MEGVVVFVEHGGHLPTQQPQVSGPVVRGQLRDGLGDVDRVAGVDDGQPRYAAEDRHVLGGLMGRPVSGGEPGQAADDVDIESGLGDVKADEVVGAPGGEHRIGGGEGHQTGLGHPRGGAEQQLLGHAHLEEPLRERLREDVHIGVLAQIGGQAHDPVIVFSRGHQRVPERGGGGALAFVGERCDHRRGA